MPALATMHKKAAAKILIGFCLAGTGLWAAGSLAAAWLLTHRLGGAVAEPAPVDSIEELRLVNEQGLELGAWFHLGQPDEQQPCVLLLHGNRASRTHLTPLFMRLVRDGRCVMALSLQGHGDSDGRVVDAGWSGRLDLRTGVETLRQRAGGRRVTVIGYSMGAAASLFAAEDLGENVAAYLLVSPYRDLLSATRARIQIYVPAVALQWIVFHSLRLAASVVLSAAPENISPLRHAEALSRQPTKAHFTFMAGGADRRAPAADVEEMSRLLSHRSRFVLVPGAGHTDLFAHDKTAFIRVLAELESRGEVSSNP